MLVRHTADQTRALRAAARARSNIALVKYWGKADGGPLNIPAVGSLSITLDALWTETEVHFDGSADEDELILNGRRRTDQLDRVSRCLDLLRGRARVEHRARVTSRNNFPTGAGLASSASGYAALTAAAAGALDLELSTRDLSIVARQGSGSAARSIFGGFVEMRAGRLPDGSDSYAEPLMPPEAWPLEFAVAVTARKQKRVSSRAGMTRSATTSPYFRAWVAKGPEDLEQGRKAVLERDFESLAEVSERNCLSMHGAAMAARPPLLYWNASTMACIETVRELRRSGVPVFFTIDAGPQLKAVCAPGASAKVRDALADVPGVLDVLVSGPGPGIEPA